MQKEENDPVMSDVDARITIGGAYRVNVILVFIKYKKLILGIAIGALIFSTIFSFLLSEMFTATTRILPPRESDTSITALLSKADGVFEGLAGSLMGGNASSDLYVGILKSRTVADTLIQKFDLKRLYKKKYIEDVYRKLSECTTINISRRDKVLSVSVEDRDPKRAADMANTYIQLLDQVNRTVNITEGHRKRVFLEQRLLKVRQDLMKAEIALKEFQEKYKLVAIEEQAKTLIQAAAKLKNAVIMAQTELEVLKQFGTERQNEAVMLRAKIDELQKQLLRIEKGVPDQNPENGRDSTERYPDFYIPFSELPAIGTQLTRLMREAKIQEKVFELVTTQHELAKIEEAKDVDTIQVLDVAVVPEKRSRPKRAVIVILFTLTSTVMSLLLLFFIEYLRVNRNRE